MFAHGLLYAFVGEGHSVGGRWHEPLLFLAIAGIGWALADRRRSGLARMGWRAGGALALLQFALFAAIEAGEGHLGELTWWKLLLAFVVQAFVATLVAGSLPAVTRMLDDRGEFLRAFRGDGRVRRAEAPPVACTPWLAARRVPRAPPTRP